MWIVLGVLLIPLVQLTPLPRAMIDLLPGRVELLRPLARLGLEPPAWAPLSLTPAATYRALLALLGPVGVVLLGRARQLSDPTPILTGVLAIALASVVLGAAQRAQGGDSALRLYVVNSTGEAIGFFSNRDHLAVFLACTLPIVGALAGDPRLLTPRGPWRGLLLAGAAVVVLAGIAMTRSRAGALLGAAALALSLFQLRQVQAPASAARSPGGSRRWGRPALAVVLAAAGLGLLAGLFAFSGGLARFTEDPELGGRSQLWGPILRLATRFLPVGAGVGSFDPLWRTVEPFGQLTGAYLNHAHNDYLESLLETGVVGPLLLAGFAVWWSRRTLSAWRADPRVSALARMGSIVTGVLLLHSAVDYPLRTPALATLFAFAVLLMADTTGPEARPAPLRGG